MCDVKLGEAFVKAFFLADTLIKEGRIDDACVFITSTADKLRAALNTGKEGDDIRHTEERG